MLLHEATNSYLPKFGDRGGALELERTTINRGHSTPQVRGLSAVDMASWLNLWFPSCLWLWLSLFKATVWVGVVVRVSMCSCVYIQGRAGLSLRCCS